MKLHKLKIEDKYFTKVKYNLKTAEIRKNDRNFEVGDILCLQEMIPINIQKGIMQPQYSGECILVMIKDILTHKTFKGLAEDYVMLSFKPIGEIKSAELRYDTDIEHTLSKNDVDKPRMP